MNHRPREIDSYRPSPSQNRGRDYLRPEDGHHEYRRSPGASLRRDDSRESSGHNPRKRPHSPQSTWSSHEIARYRSRSRNDKYDSPPSLESGNERSHMEQSSQRTEQNTN
uniref:Uncharacterized protein n=1 Tax=Pyronema omphalodes (strain CBS 100304) TaxID=1076935 RepID=U4LS44_PYROM